MNPVWGFYNRRKNWWRRGKRVGKRLIIINITIILLVFWNSYWFLKNMGSKWSKKKKKIEAGSLSSYIIKIIIKKGRKKRDRKALLAEEAGEGTVRETERPCWLKKQERAQCVGIGSRKAFGSTAGMKDNIGWE